MVRRSVRPSGWVNCQRTSCASVTKVIFGLLPIVIKLVTNVQTELKELVNLVFVIS